MVKHNLIDKIESVILGHAVADALGVPVEFATRMELQENPVTDMRGYGAHEVPKGTWSDDTSLSLAALDSLCKGTIDWDEILTNFGKWLEDNKYTATGEVFDSGRTCVRALINYFSRKMPATECGEDDEYSNGNGSLMRIHPFVLFSYARHMNTCETMDMIHSASALTHSHERSKVGCGIYSCILRKILDNPDKIAIKEGLEQAQAYYKNYVEIEKYKRLFQIDFMKTESNDIKSSGYIVDTLEAAVWCLLTTNNYHDCVLKAVNLGDDTDTVAAVAGGLAGALYGYNTIPEEWLNTLIKRDYIEEMCKRAHKGWS